jgi:hypothetical protein
MILKRSTKLGLAVAAALGFASSANASLTLLGPENFAGTGLGSVNTILTMTSPGSTTTESGAVSFNGTTDVITGDAGTGASQTQTRLLGALGVTAPSTLRVVFNAVEPSGDSITLNGLTLTLYTAAGANFFDASLDQASYAFANTFTGTGNSGFVFGLNAAEQTELTGLLGAAGAPTLASLRAGLSASASNATGGNETFFVANSGTPVPPTAVPEPETYAMMLAGLGLLGFIARRRARNQV